MQGLKTMSILGSLLLSGCYVTPYPPQERLVERDVVDQNGNVVERDHYVVDEVPPPPRVEVVGVAPFPGALWIHGYWGHERYGWRWRPGYWR